MGEERRPLNERLKAKLRELKTDELFNTFAKTGGRNRMMPTVNTAIAKCTKTQQIN